MKSGTCLFTEKAMRGKADAVGSRKQAPGPSQKGTMMLVLGEFQHHPKSVPLRQAQVTATSATYRQNEAPA